MDKLISKKQNVDNTYKNIKDQTWNVIYSYFKNYKNWMTRHQLDSYNDFIHNNIPRIFKQKGYYKVLSYRGDYAHVFEIYLGGKNHDKFRLSHPTFYDHLSGNMRPLYPNEARLRNLTYGADLFYDVEIILNVYKGDNNETHVIKDYKFPDADFLKNIYLGNIPIMIHSDICSLNKIPKANLHLYGENPDEPGGYIILDGAEKVLLCQQRKAENVIFLSEIKSSQSDKYKHQAIIKSKHDGAFEFARDNCIYMENKGELVMRIGPIGKEFIRPISSPEFKGFNNKYIPVFILFRYLGVESDKEIIEMICGKLDNPLSNKMSNELIPSIQDEVIMRYNIYDKQGAELLLSKLERTRTQLSGGVELKDISKNKVQTLSYLHQSIRLNLLPHAGEEHKQKAYYLAYMIRRLLLNYLKIDETGNTSLDTFMSKRIDTGGYLLSTLFRTAFIEGILYNIRRQIDKILELNPDMRGSEAYNVINENSYRTIFSVESFNIYFTNKLKVGVFGNKTGVLQQLERVNYYSVISHLRRVVDPTFGDSSTITIERRELNSTQYGFLCPNESPEGGNIGLRQAISILSTISIGYPISQLKQWCYKNGVEPLTSRDSISNLEDIKVFVNGCWLGCHPNAINFVNLFKLYRRNGLINATTSISLQSLQGEIHIFCDDGRLVRPLYCVEDNELLMTNKMFNDIDNDKLKFDNLCTSKLFLEKKLPIKWDLRDTNVYNVDRIGLDENDENLVEKLQLSQGVIEYVDPYESDTILISINLPMPDITELLQKKISYTHVELHPSTMLGFMAHISPCTHHSQGGKYLASGGTKHPKQSLSVYHPCHDTRFDTGKIFLAHNTERAIVHGRMNTSINHHKYGTGQNIIVAIAYYNEDNQEDGILFNKSSLDMGLFNACYYKTYEAHESVDEKTGLEEKFYNPYYRNENENYPQELDENHGNYTYEHLDEHGFIKEGTHLTGNEVLIGKFLKITDSFGEEKYEDLSTHVKADNKDSYVDKVFTCATNSKGLKLGKVRTCQVRKPEHGDKFASRNGNKGTIGLMIPEVDMPFTEDGLIPDIIINPTSYPKRLTVSQLMEPVFAELGINLGFFPQANTMENIEMTEIVKVLEDAGLSYCGDKVLYNGVYGNQMKNAIFMGSFYFQRSILQTRDKINARGGEHRVDSIPVPGGGYTAKERQVVSGRANGGGVKIGEMERDSLLSHGLMSFINESWTTRGDCFYVYISPITGEIMVGNPDDKIFFDNSVDGPIAYHLKEGTGQGKKDIIGPNLFHKKQNKFVKVKIPYAMKLLIHDYMGLGKEIRLKPEVKKVVYNKYISGDNLDNLLLEFDDIITQQNEKVNEYLKQSLVEQLANEKIENMKDSDTLSHINEQLENERLEKLNTLQELNNDNEFEFDIDETQQKYNLDNSIPHPFSLLNRPDIGNYSLDGIASKTSGGQDFGVINLNQNNTTSPLIHSPNSSNSSYTNNIPTAQYLIPRNDDSSSNLLANKLDEPSQYVNNSENAKPINLHDFLNNRNTNSPLNSNNSGNSGNSYNLGSGSNSQLGGGDGNYTETLNMLKDLDLGDMSEINFSDLDINSKNNQYGGNNSQSVNTPDVKKVLFDANDKEKIAMGL